MQLARTSITKVKLLRNSLYILETTVFLVLVSSVYYFNNKSLFNSFLFLLNMNFITMKWVFWPWGRKLLFEFEFVKKSSPILQHQGEKYLLNITFFTGFSHSGWKYIFHKSKRYKREVHNNTTLNYFYVYNPTSWKLQP